MKDPSIKDIDINKIDPTPQKWTPYRPRGVMFVCLECDTQIANPAITMKEFDCPNCGSKLAPVKKFGIIPFDGTDEASIITDPN